MNAPDLKVKVEAFLNSRAATCDICGAAGNLVVGSTRKKRVKLSVRCMKHTRGLHQEYMRCVDLPIAGGEHLVKIAQAAGVPAGQRFQVSNGASQPARDDAAWFMANPGRTHRVRAAFTGEVPGVEPLVDVVVLVRQVEPGKRIRRSVTADRAIPDDDDVLAVVFDMPVGELVDVQEAIARAELLRSMGGTA